jgi:hypothetical protein
MEAKGRHTMVIMLSDVGGITGVVSTLKTLAVSEGVIGQIVKILQGESSNLEDGVVQPVKPSWFGGGGSGTTLGTHTDKAHAKVSNAILEAVASLQATGTAMKAFDSDVTVTDENNAAATTALIARTQQAVDMLDDDRTTPVPPVTTQEGQG